MKIAFVNEGIYEYATGSPDAAGGLERDQWLLSRTLAAHGWEAVVGVSGPLRPGGRTIIDNVQYVGIPEGHKLLAWQKFLFTERPNWLFWEGAGHLLGLFVELASLANARTIFHTAFDTDVYPRRALSRRRRWWPLYAWGLARVTRILVQHRTQLSELPGQWRAKASVLPKVCDLSNRFAEPVDVKPHSQRQRCVAWVAMLRQPKRPDVLIEIARAAPDISFVVCGGITHHRSPPEYGDQIVKALSALPNVNYRGRVSPREAAQVIADSAMVLSTSDEEGFPNVFIQAWGTGTPVVSLKLDPDSIIDRIGLGAVSGSMEKAIKDMRLLLNSPLERERIGSRARRYIAEAHSESAVVSAFERAIYGAA